MRDEAKLRRYAEKIRIFNGLEPEEVELMLRHGRIMHFHEGQTIFHEGMPGSNLFIILSGEVTMNLKNRQIARCRMGDVFGEMAVLNKRPRAASATSVSPVKVLTLSESDLNEIMNQRVALKVLLNVIHVLSERLETANSTIAYHGLEMGRR